ncbi:DUF3422 family protein [Chachezhania antarctica]|mgnify:CR=1 FL=1|uniref:DUF3422 family protein n=1 Tax=Chachezhania antarctica TaxID=2340860 RepID=UPI000EAD66BB|nr:DUF3422 domain-containing protein [Chachezhania antarctica]|tara:strand:- start:6073 stop:7350 length:1278 start_codon:yes stop_codon:yes gene_type:complete
MPFSDHPLRYRLANELHARPFPTVSAPSRVVYLAIKRNADAAARDRGADRAHLILLLDRHGAAHPQPGATHYTGQIGRHRIKWESHTEFVTYTVFTDGDGLGPFDPAAFDLFPKDWLEDSPGERMSSVLIEVLPRPSDDRIVTHLQDWFVPESLAAAHVLDDAGVAAGDFRIDPAGHMRFALFVNPDTGERRVGRVLQRLCEMETYKAMSMLGFARAQDLSPAVGRLDAALSGLMAEMTDAVTPPEDTLPRLLEISAELERIGAEAAFRFGATRAYEAIVQQRTAALREARFTGRQTFADFMQRRYEPAMRTVAATERRIETLSDRAMRAGDLLRTKVDVDRSAQNQKLLESMDRRADMQLRLQHTVEGLSVVAVSYYAVSLAGYVLAPLGAEAGFGKEAVMAMVALPVIAAVWVMVRRIRRRFR